MLTKLSLDEIVQNVKRLHSARLFLRVLIAARPSKEVKISKFLKRPISLAICLVALLTIITSGNYWYHQRHIKYLNASLRDSCGVKELLIGVRGSGETGDQIGGLGDVAGSVEHQFSNDMQPTQIAGAPVDYEAVSVSDIRTVGMYDQSYAQGVQQLYNSLYYWNHACPNYRFVLAGYSQGADVLGAVLAGLNPNNATENQILNKIDGAALLGDPRYNPAMGSVNANGAATAPGLLSAMPSNHRGVRPNFPSYLSGRVRSWCRSGDPVCQVPLGCTLAQYVNVQRLAYGAACLASIELTVNQHLQYVSGGQTADAAAWLAGKVRNPYTPPAQLSPAKTVTTAPNSNPGPKTHTQTPSAPAKKSTPPPTPPATVIKYNVPPHAPAPTPPAVPPPNRVAITSYDRMQPGAPHNGYYDVAWQDFTAQSNIITYLSATVGSQGAAGASTGVPLTLRLCTSVNCSTVLAQTSPQIVNYGETGSDIGDVHVTPGATYYIVWYQPAPINGQTWYTYWWTGGSTISSSDQMQAVVRGYNHP